MGPPRVITGWTIGRFSLMHHGNIMWKKIYGGDFDDHAYAMTLSQMAVLFCPALLHLMTSMYQVIMVKQLRMISGWRN
jgi:hypothetical protein